MGKQQTEGGDVDDSPEKTLVWMCPFCCKRGMSWEAVDGSGAQGALRSHIYATEGDGHGPANAYPADFDSDTLSDYITATDPDK